MLPCNFVVQENEEGKVEVSAIDPAVSMQGVNNSALFEIAGEVRDKLKKIVESI
jgi:uncharacterized protein (DUF302 family)